MIAERRIRGQYLKRNYPGGDNAVAPPESMPNSEVKRCYADGSVGYPHVRVGHRQVVMKRGPHREMRAFFCACAHTIPTN